LAGSISLSTPSFTINSAKKNAGPEPNWHSINSRFLLQNAKRIYFEYLLNTSASRSPLGIVVNGINNRGYIAYANPILLANEHFVDLKYLIDKRKVKVFHKN